MKDTHKMMAATAAVAMFAMAFVFSVCVVSEDSEAAATEITIAPGMRYTYTPTYPSDLTVTTTIESQGIGTATNGTWGTMSSGSLIVNVPIGTAAGTVYNVKLKATSTNPTQTAYIEIAFNVVANLVVSGSQANIVTGSPINMVPTATGMGTVTWAVKSGTSLPDGLSLNTTTGTVTGTPTGLGVKTIQLTATTSYGETKDLTVTFSIMSKLVPQNSPTVGVIIYVVQ